MLPTSSFRTAALALLGMLLAWPALADGLDYFEKRLEPYRDRSAFTAPGPAFDARTCMKGKPVFSSPVSSASGRKSLGGSRPRSGWTVAGAGNSPPASLGRRSGAGSRRAARASAWGSAWPESSPVGE